jgi:hypothetical protein
VQNPETGLTVGNETNPPVENQKPAVETNPVRVNPSPNAHDQSSLRAWPAAGL